MNKNSSLRAGAGTKNGTPAYRLIADDLRNQIESLRLRVGDFLPTEQALVETYSVSRMTLRAALKELAAEGLIRPRRPLGWEILKTPKELMRLFCIVAGNEAAADYQMVKAAGMECQQRGISYRPVFLAEWPDTLESLLHPSQQAGVLFLSGLPVPDNLVRSVTAGGIPTAMVGTAPGGVDAVCSDERFAAELMVEHLAVTGHRRILYLGWDSSEDPSFNALNVGVAAACSRYSVVVDMFLTQLNWLSPEDEAKLTQCLTSADGRPDVVLFGSQPICMLALGIISRMGLRIPEDISLALMGDVPPMGSEAVIGRSITHIHYDWAAAVHWAVERVARRARESDLPPIRGEFPLELIVGETTTGRDLKEMD